MRNPGLVALMGKVSGDALRQGDRPVAASRTTYGYGQVALALAQVVGQKEEQKFRDAPHKLLGLRVRFHKTLYGAVAAGLALQPRLIVGIGKEAHVENQVRIGGDAKSESEGNN